MTIRSILVAGATALVATFLWSAPSVTAVPFRADPAVASSEAPSKGPVGWDVYRRLDRMAEIPVGVETRSFSSFDRTGGNGDAVGTGASCLSNSTTGCLIASHDGPGEIDSIWFTNIGPGGLGDVTPDGNLRVQLDGKTVLDKPLESLVEGASGAPFVYPLVADSAQSSGGVYIKVPMPFQQSMRVYTSNTPTYYHLDYRVFADAVGVNTFDPTDQATDVVAKLRTSGTADPKPAAPGAVTTSSPFSVAPGQSATLATEGGPGSISALHLSLPALAGGNASSQAAPASTVQRTSGTVSLVLDPGNQGVKLIYQGPSGTPPQRAPLFLDGQSVGQLSEPVGTGSFTQTLILPVTLTAGKSRAIIKNLLIVPGSALTAVSQRDGQPIHSDVIQPAQQSGQLLKPAANVATSPASDLLSGLRIRLTFDGQQTVDLPIGSFFASPLDGSPVSSLLLAVSSGSFTSWQLMPYATSAVAELYNGSDATVTGSSDVTAAPSSAWTTALAPGGSSGYFRAVSHEADTSLGTDFPLLDQSGPGKLLGVSLTMSGSSPGAGFLEGDERFTLDGSRTPQEQGTGTEDFFEGGWYFSNGVFSAPFNGLVSHEFATNGCANECFSAYRFFVADSVPFHASAHLSIEHGNRNDTAANYAATAYLYSGANPSVRVTGAVDLGQASSESAAQLTVQGNAPPVRLTSTFEGPYDSVPVDGVERIGTGTTTFTLPSDPASDSVTLRRTSDQATAGQAARVTVNGQSAGLWTQPLGNTTSRWLEDDYRLPPALTSGYNALQISIVPVMGSPPWSAARYSILCEGPDTADTTAPSFTGVVSGASIPAGVSLSWLPAADDSPSVHYNVYRSAMGALTPATATLVGETSMSGFVDSLAPLNSTQHYIVQPVDESGNVGQPSPETAVTTSSRLFLEGEDTSSTATAAASVQSMTQFGPGWSDGAQEWLQATAPGQSLTYTVNVPTAATYGLTLGLTQAGDYATATVAVDGHQIGSAFDGYSSAVSPTGPLAFGFVSLSAGTHKVTMTVVGRDPSSSGYYVGVDYLQFDDVGQGDPIQRKDSDLVAAGLNLGAPVGGEQQDSRGLGQDYQGGEILWTPDTAAHEVHGAIRAHYDDLGGPSSFLGFPATDETGTPDGSGRFNHFSSTANASNTDGSIYWTPATGAWSIHGAIRAKWASLGWERSCLGYPVSDEFGIPGGRQSNFQLGVMTYSFSAYRTTASC